MWRGLWTIWTATWTVALVGIGVSPQSAMGNVSEWLQIMGLESWSAYMAPPSPSERAVSSAERFVTEVLSSTGADGEKAAAAKNEPDIQARDVDKSTPSPPPAPAAIETWSDVSPEGGTVVAAAPAEAAAAPAEAQARPDFWRLDSYLVLFASALLAFALGAAMLVMSLRRRRQAHHASA